MLIADPALVINELLADERPYDFRKDLTPVSLVSRAPYILVRSPALKADTVQDIVDEAKNKKDGLSFASAGVGTAAHMTGELFRLKTGSSLVHVPYRSGGAAMTDLASGLVDLAFTTISAAKPYIEKGLAVAIATTGKERSEEFPDTPTLYESIDGFEVYFWTSLFVPNGTPDAIVKQLTELTHQALGKEKVQLGFKQGGSIAMPMSSQETGTFIENEASMWEKVIEQSGMKESGK